MSFLEKSIVQLDLSPEVFLVVYEYLYHTRLGDTNAFESAISEFMSANSALDELAADLADIYETPKLGVQMSEEDGLVFTVQ